MSKVCTWLVYKIISLRFSHNNSLFMIHFRTSELEQVNHNSRFFFLICIETLDFNARSCSMQQARINLISTRKNTLHNTFFMFLNTAFLLALLSSLYLQCNFNPILYMLPKMRFSLPAPNVYCYRYYAYGLDKIFPQFLLFLFC